MACLQVIISLLEIQLIYSKVVSSLPRAVAGHGWGSGGSLDGWRSENMYWPKRSGGFLTNSLENTIGKK